MRRTLVAALAAGSLLACTEGKSANACSRDSDCASGLACVGGACKAAVPSGGSVGAVSGSARLTAGSLTMDAVIGQPVTPTGTAGVQTMVPAENTR